jgi:CheY-like chemotaxis protein
VLVVGRSKITLVVVSKIVERSGLKPISHTPEEAVAALLSQMPCLVILDGGADNTDCDILMESLVAMRRASGKDLPRTILLSIRNLPYIDKPSVDAVVSKPITTERLQPVVDRLVDHARR